MITRVSIPGPSARELMSRRRTPSAKRSSAPAQPPAGSSRFSWTFTPASAASRSGATAATTTGWTPSASRTNSSSSPVSRARREWSRGSPQRKLPAAAGAWRIGYGGSRRAIEPSGLNGNSARQRASAGASSAVRGPCGPRMTWRRSPATPGSSTRGERSRSPARGRTGQRHSDFTVPVAIAAAHVSLSRRMLSRSAAVSALTAEPFDVLVIGGGITGAGVALDAATRGYSVALVERGDYAGGTSSRSSKLVHGGLRYLQNFDLGLVREALLERQVNVNLAPYLVRPLRFVVPAFDGDRPDRVVRLGLNMYDVMPRRRRRGRDRDEDWCPARHRAIGGGQGGRALPARG